MTEKTLSRINTMMVACEQLIELFKETENKQLISYADSYDESITQLKQMLADGVDSKLGREIVKGLRQGLREIPGLITREMREQSERLIPEFENKLGCKFSDF
jgi:hypothetical protein